MERLGGGPGGGGDWAVSIQTEPSLNQKAPFFKGCRRRALSLPRELLLTSQAGAPREGNMAVILAQKPGQHL